MQELRDDDKKPAPVKSTFINDEAAEQGECDFPSN